MTAYAPNTPRLAKVAIVIFERNAPSPSVVTFQYNPETLTRDLKANAMEGGAASEAFRLNGAPTETLKLECFFDATDDLEANETTARAHGVRHKLAALEMLLYPSVKTVRTNAALLQLGTIEILPMQGPFTVLVLGSRVLPFRLSGLSIAEEFFDENLNPIRAKVSLDLTVLTYSDLERSHPGYSIYLGHQAVQETLAGLGRKSVPASILSQKLGAV